MFLESFKTTFSAVIQIFILGAFGFILVKKKFITEEGLSLISRLIIEIIFPVLIFTKLTKNFSFSAYPDWWIFPLLSILITLLGFLVGFIFLKFIKGHNHKLQFLSLVAFQNSGYMPLAMAAGMFSQAQAESIFIYIFLFLLGFDLVMWSIGVYMLTSVFTKKFELGSLFSPPVIANLVSLTIVFFGINKFFPEIIFKPLEMVGNCTLPLAMFVVGGNIAMVKLHHVEKLSITLMVIAKLVLLPLCGLFILLKLQVPELLGILILMQLAMPPATSLSVIVRHYKRDDLLVSQGVFFGHIISLITVPVFLSLYLALRR